MTAKWTTQTFPANVTDQTSSDVPTEEFVVLLLYGKNSFGDKIYSYLKITLPAIDKLKAAVQAGSGFNPSDFGTVIAAGKGDPTDEVRKEVTALYKVFDAQKMPRLAPADIPTEKKAWDEY